MTNTKFKYMVMVSREVANDYWEDEYSGIYHDNRKSAEKELAEAKEHTKKDATVNYCYIDFR